MLKFNLIIKKKNEIRKLHLNFENRLKDQNLSFIFYFFKKLKIEEQIRFYG